MSAPFYHLAQFNIARMLGETVDSPIMAGFASQIAMMNAAAEVHGSFVWRLTTPAGEDTGAYSDPRMLVNLSVWLDIEGLKDFTYRSIHKGPVRDRGQWFERPTEAHLALWWIPAGHIPTVQEAVERLEHLRQHGPSPAAFLFAKPFTAPDAPTAATGTAPLDLNNRIFTTASNSANGDASGSTHFHYRQRGSRVWATYRGGRIRFGTLTAAWTAAGQLDMRYQHTSEDGGYRTGKCTSTPVSGSPIVLDEDWQWTNGDGTRGQSRLIEVMPATQEKSA